MTLKKIEINELFWRYTYHIDLTSDCGIKMITGPNGYGKSTIIRMLSNLYTGNIHYFFEVPFSSLKLTFANTTNSLYSVSVTKITNTSDLTDSLSGEMSELKLVLCEKDSIISEFSISKEKADSLLQKNDKNVHHPASTTVLSPNIEQIFAGHVELLMFIQELNVLHIEDQRLYYTADATYTSAIKYTGSTSRVSSDSLELKERIIRLKNKLSELLQEKTISAIREPNYAALTESEYIDRIEQVNKKIRQLTICGIATEVQFLETKMQKEAAKMLANILTAYEQVITEIHNEAKDVLLLLKLIEHSEFPDKICTLNTLSGYCFTDSKGNYIPVELLSSGEQHKLVMYYQLLFNTRESMLVLIDEPELSFHVVWQSTFIDEMKQLVNARKLQMIIATHSPQIIDGKWSLTQDLFQSAILKADA